MNRRTLVMFNFFLFQNLGAMIVPSMKYNISEVSLNDYHFVSTLHIKSLNKNDFAQYVCVAKNTIGKSEEMIKIYGNFCISFALTLSGMGLESMKNAHL